MDTTKEAYKAKMEAQLDVWSARIAELKAKADKAAADAKVELLKHSDELKALESSARKHIEEVEAAAADSWHKVKSGIDEKWSQLSGSLEAVWAKLSPDQTTKH